MRGALLRAAVAGWLCKASRGTGATIQALRAGITRWRERREVRAALALGKELEKKAPEMVLMLSLIHIFA